MPYTIADMYRHLAANDVWMKDLLRDPTCAKYHKEVSTTIRDLYESDVNKRFFNLLAFAHTAIGALLEGKHDFYFTANANVKKLTWLVWYWFTRNQPEKRKLLSDALRRSYAKTT